jgi:pilus assembly protein Flp/PilA
MLQTIKATLSDDQGQGLAEYGLILGLVAILAVTALGLLKTSVVGMLTAVANAI